MKSFYYCFILLASVLFAACESSDSDSLSEIELSKDTSKEQTVFADDISKNEGIKFNATSDWTATVREVAIGRSEANGVEWLKLSAYSGNAGQNTISLTFTENLTGKDRKAEITIQCGLTIITIAVVQKGENSDGKLLKLVDKITFTADVTSYENGNEEETMVLKYDSNGRVAEIQKESTSSYDSEKGVYSFDYDIVDEIRVTYSTEYDTENMYVALNEQGFATQINFFDEHMYEDSKVEFKYNEDGQLAIIRSYEDTSLEETFNLYYTDKAITKYEMWERGSDKDIQEFPLNTLYPHKYENKTVSNIDPNALSFYLDDDYQFLYMLRYLGVPSKYLLEFFEGNGDYEGSRAEEWCDKPNYTETYTTTEIIYDNEDGDRLEYAFDEDGCVTTITNKEAYKKVKKTYTHTSDSEPVYPGAPYYPWGESKLVKTEDAGSGVDTYKYVITYKK